MELSPSIMSELFKLKETKYELRRGIKLNSNIPRTTTYSIASDWILLWWILTEPDFSKSVSKDDVLSL